MNATIADDKTALRLCRTLHTFREFEGYTFAGLGRFLGISQNDVIKLELHPEDCEPGLYNTAAKVMGWPLYLPGGDEHI